jgi:translation initiation factor 2 subunit 1
LKGLVEHGETFPALVLKIDGPYIDLSKTKVSPEDIKEKNISYGKRKKIHQILNNVVIKSHIEMKTLYENLIFLLDEENVFSFMENLTMEDLTDFDFPNEVKTAIYDESKLRFKKKPQIVYAFIDLMCFAYEGIEAIKEALLAGQSCGEIQITYVSAPVYRLLCKDVDVEKSRDLILTCHKIIKSTIEKYNGQCILTTGPLVVGNEEEIQYQEKEKVQDEFCFEKDDDDE